jgi:hypothetical protein
LIAPLMSPYQPPRQAPGTYRARYTVKTLKNSVINWHRF